MTVQKKLRQVKVTPMQGHVGITLVYAEGPAEHVLLPDNWASTLADKIREVLQMRRDQAPGDAVGVTDAAMLSISKPKETLQ